MDDPVRAHIAEAAASRPVGQPHDPKRARWRQRFLRCLLSDDPRIAEQVRFGLTSMCQHVIWTFLYLNAGRSGTMGRGAAQLIVATTLAGAFGFYPWVRFGWTRRLRDSGLLVPQILWASMICVLGFGFAPELRPAQLQMLCMIQVYGFFSLQPRQVALTGGVATGLFAAALLAGLLGALPNFDLQREIYPALLTFVVLVCIIAITFDHSVRRGRMRAQKIELNAAVAAVRDLVICDTLTGLFNRRHMQELLEEEHARTLRTGRPFAVALLDLDHFKRVNDAHGHGAGDEVLCRFADLAKLAVRQSDTIARWGGEEFLVLMPETCLEGEALAPLERLRTELHQQDADSLLARLGVTFSAGVAFQHEGRPVAEALARADGALYAAKAAGRNRLSMAKQFQAQLAVRSVA